jgi:hypothetical protein
VEGRGRRERKGEGGRKEGMEGNGEEEQLSAHIATTQYPNKVLGHNRITQKKKKKKKKQLLYFPHPPSLFTSKEKEGEKSIHDASPP